MESIKAPTDQDGQAIQAVLNGLDQVNLNHEESEYDVIKKPRTKFTTNVLRRAIPDLNIQDKIGSISLNKLNVLSAMRLGPTAGSETQINSSATKKVKTVMNLPRMLSIDHGGLDNILLPKKLHQKKSSGMIKEKFMQAPSNLEGNIPEKDGEESLEGISEKDDEIFKDKGIDEESKDDDSSNSDSDDDDESSIDMDGENDEEKLYAQIVAGQDSAQIMKDAKKKGEHLDDLVDEEMISLLNVCKRLHVPKLEALASKFVDFGPNPEGKKVLILDMDETMLHAKFIQNAEEEQNHDGDFVFTLQSEKSGSKDVAGQPGDSLMVSIKMRPFLDEALDFLAKYYEICVFTAGTQDYADACLDFIDKDRQIIKHRLYRQHCVNPVYGVYVKDLRIIRDRDIKDIILVDNSILSFAFQLDNGIPIKPFMRQQNDEELLFMVTFLEEIYSYPDPRVHVRKTFCLKDLMHRYCKNTV